MRFDQVRRPQKGRHDWLGAAMMVPAALGFFVLLRLIGPAVSVQAAALLAGALGVLLIRACRPLAARVRRRG